MNPTWPPIIHLLHMSMTLHMLSIAKRKWRIICH
jgi:hypothetical protein